MLPPRYRDAKPNVNIEAIATDVPVIATRGGGTGEIVVYGETSFRVEKEKPEQIA